MTFSNSSHSITFRLDSQEYDRLLKAVSKRDATISEFTRIAVLNGVVACSLERFVRDELESLMISLDMFDAKMRELRRQILQLATKTNAVPN
jgi:hypothetical protein